MMKRQSGKIKAGLLSVVLFVVISQTVCAGSIDCLIQEDTACQQNPICLQENTTLEITEIKGGLGFTVEITNTGEVNATNVEWEIAIGILHPTWVYNGTWDSLAPGESRIASVSPLIGLGIPKYTISAQADNAEQTSVKGKILVLFILVIPLK